MLYIIALNAYEKAEAGSSRDVLVIAFLGPDDENTGPMADPFNLCKHEGLLLNLL